MTFVGTLLALSTLAAPSTGGPTGDVAISGDYVEFRTADVFTGPCFANAEIGLTGNEAAMIWHIRQGAWKGVPLAGLSVVGVVRSTVTLGDPYAKPGPVRSVVIVDARATEAQRAALVEFARAQAPELLANVAVVEAMPIQFSESGHGRVSVSVGETGEAVAVATRPFNDGDHFCTNETAFYEPLVGNLSHAMPVMTVRSQYQGGHLGKTWRDAHRRGSYVGSFAVGVLQAD